MQFIKFKSFLFVLALSVVALAIAVLILSVLMISGFNSLNTAVFPMAPINIMKLQLTGIVLLTSLLIVTFILVDKKAFNPLTKISEGIQEIKNGLLQENLEIKDNSIKGVVKAFNEMSASLNQNRKKLESQTSELSDKNWELQEANSELEASYCQLQAIIEQLNEAEQKYHSLVKNIPEVVCVFDTIGTISFINRLCFDMLGYEKSEVMGKSILSLIKEDAVFSIDQIIMKLERKSSVTIELQLKKKDGLSILTEASFTYYIVNGINMGLQAIIRDITGKRELEEKIIQSNKELETINSVSKSLTSTLDVDSLLKLIVDEVTEKLDYQACLLGLIDSRGVNLHARAFSGVNYSGINRIAEFGVIRTDHELIARVINNNEIVRTSNIPGDWIVGKFNSNKSEKDKVHELVIAPIRVNDRKIGILVVGSNSKFKSNDVSLISSIANSAAVAIDNAMLYDTSKKYFIKTIDALIAAVEAKDTYTEGHSQRVSKYAMRIAKKLGLEKDCIEDIKIAGILHDIGKIGIRDNILQKQDKLSREEYEEVKQHPSISNKILYPVGFSERTLKAIAFHHERYDGSGYPFGISGDDISLEAQIIAVADAYDAMTSNRSYRTTMGRDEALEELVANKGKQFGPSVVDAFIEIINEQENAA